MTEKPKFCQGCEYLPEGVEAEAADAEVVTMGELRRYRFAHDPAGREVAEQTAGLIRVRAIVTKSNKRGTDEGDGAAMLVQPKGRSPEEVLAAIGNCSGPQRSVVDRVLGRRGTCPAVKRA